MKKSKAILMVVCAMLLVAASVMGTLAYLTSTASVTNTFTVGKVAITLDEAPVDADGQKTTGARVSANTYHLLPGHEYDKDPTIHVDEKSEDCYLFVKVENGIAAIEDSTNTIAAQMAANGWTAVDGTTNVYAYKNVASAGDDVEVFKSFTISGNVSNEKLAGTPAATTPDGETIPAVEGYDGATVVVTAYAVQADGFDTAAAAWTAANFS